MVEIDPRLAARRHEVAEAHARSSFSRVIRVLTLAALMALATWLFRSPLLALHTVTVVGMEAEELEEILTASGLVVGRPMIAIRTGEVEAALAADPRVGEADVRLDWPQSAQVYVEPRLPVAWAPFQGSWAQVGVDAVVITLAEAPDHQLPRLEIEDVGDQPSAAALGGLAFLAELSAQPGIDIVVREEDSELWADVAGTRVRLGRPIDMEAKARALVAILAEGIPLDATVNLLAPTRPAVVLPTDEKPQPQLEP